MNRRATICLAHRRRGLTLVEMAISAVIAIFVIGATYSVFVATLKLQYNNVQYNRINTEARLLADYLSKDIRSASSVETTYYDGSTTYSATSTTLVLKLPAIDADGDVINPDTTFDYIVYSAEMGGTTVMRRRIFPHGSSARPAETRIVGRSTIPSITVDGTYQTKPDALGAYQVHFEFTSVRNFRGKEYREPVAGTVRLRNKL